MKNSLTLTSLANKFFIAFRDENDEPIYTYTDPFMRNFKRKSVEGVRCIAVNQQHRSENSTEVFIFFQKSKR